MSLILELRRRGYHKEATFLAKIAEDELTKKVELWREAHSSKDKQQLAKAVNSFTANELTQIIKSPAAKQKSKEIEAFLKSIAQFHKEPAVTKNAKQALKNIENIERKNTRFNAHSAVSYFQKAKIPDEALDPQGESALILKVPGDIEFDFDFDSGKATMIKDGKQSVYDISEVLFKKVVKVWHAQKKLEQAKQKKENAEKPDSEAEEISDEDVIESRSKGGFGQKMIDKGYSALDGITSLIGKHLPRYFKFPSGAHIEHLVKATNQVEGIVSNLQEQAQNEEDPTTKMGLEMYAGLLESVNSAFRKGVSKHHKG